MQLAPRSERLADLTGHGGRDAEEEEDSGSSVIRPSLAVASSWPSASALREGFSLLVLLHTQEHKELTLLTATCILDSLFFHSVANRGSI